MNTKRSSRTYSTFILALLLAAFFAPTREAKSAGEIVLRVLHGSHIGGPNWYGVYDDDEAQVYATHSSQTPNTVGGMAIDGDGGTLTAYGFTFRRVDVYTYSPDNSGLPTYNTLTLYSDDPAPSPTPSTSLTDSDEKDGGGCGEASSLDPMPPMASYSIHSRMVSLNIHDRPFRYQPPRGPAIDFIVTYNQQETLPPASGTCSTLGPKWTFNWLAYITDDPSTQLPSISVYVPNGGAEIFPYNSGSQSFSRHPKSHALLVKTGAASYERQFPDGSKQVFALSNSATSYPRRIYMTQLVDAAGNAATIGYDASYRVTTLTDALGQVSTISYESLDDSFKITKITEPFSTGRFASFDYTNGQLTTITDEIGIQSQFHYASGTDFIDQLTTPYGTTLFSTGQSGTNRWINVTDPLGGTERVEYRDNAPGIALADAASTVPSGFQNGSLNSANTFFWDKKTLETYPPVSGVYDYTKARITHWLYNADYTVSGIAASVKAPLENRVWYRYAGQTNYLCAGPSANPTKVAKVLDDGTPQTFQYAYNSNDKLTKATDPIGRVTSFAYASNGIDVTAVYQKRSGGASTDPDGNAADKIASFTYDPLHPRLVASSTGAAGYSTNFVYNSYGQLRTVTNPKSEVTTYVYDRDQNTDGITDGYLISVTGPVTGASTSYSYDSAKRVQTVTDSESYAVTAAYDNIDRITSLTFPDSTTQQLKYTKYVNGVDSGMMTLDLGASKDRRGQWTYREYNANRQLTKITDPLSRNTLFDWCSCGSLGSITDANTHVTSFIRDIQGRVTSKIFADSKSINYAYENTTSRLKSMADAKNQWTNYQYWGDNDLKQISYTNGTGGALTPPTPTASFTYDPSYNHIASMVDGTGTTNYSFKPIVASPSVGAGQLEWVDGPLSTTTDKITYTYDELGRELSAAVNAIAASRTLDSLGRVATVTNPLGTFTNTYLSTVSPRLQGTTVTTGPSITYSYYPNSGDKRPQTILNKTSGGTLHSQFDYAYDSDGEITQWTKQLGAGTPNSYVWAGNSGVINDAADQLKWFSEGVGGGLGGLFQFGYDNAGNQTLNLHGSFAYNNVNQITNSGYTYDNNGNLTADVDRTYEWDAANRLIAINYPAVPTLRSEFTYDGLGRRVKIVEKGLGAPSISFSFTPASKQYAVYPSSSPPSYSLAAGNYILTIAGLNPESGNSVGLVDAIKFNGTIITTNGSFETPAITGGTSVTNPAGATPWSFTLTSGFSKNNSAYMANADAPDTRQVGFVKNSGTISQTMTLSAGNYALKLSGAQATGNTTPQQMQATLQSLTPVITSTKQFVWNRNTIAEERDASNNVTRRFYPQGEQIGGVKYFYTRDHLGSVRELVDSTGAIRARYDYDPFGVRTKLSGDLEASFGYTGHYHHAVSGLSFTPRRAYDSHTGRWLSRDPLHNAELLQGPNLYTYVGNDPLNTIDPTGESDIPAWVPFVGGGRIYNDTNYPVRVLANHGTWIQLLPGDSTSYNDDADGYWDRCGIWHRIHNGNGTTRVSSNPNPGGGPTNAGLPTDVRPYGGGGSSW